MESRRILVITFLLSSVLLCQSCEDSNRNGDGDIKVESNDDSMSATTTSDGGVNVENEVGEEIPIPDECGPYPWYPAN